MQTYLHIPGEGDLHILTVEHEGEISQEVLQDCCSDGPEDYPGDVLVRFNTETKRYEEAVVEHGVTVEADEDSDDEEDEYGYWIERWRSL